MFTPSLASELNKVQENEAVVILYVSVHVVSLQSGGAATETSTATILPCLYSDLCRGALWLHLMPLEYLSLAGAMGVKPQIKINRKKKKTTLPYSAL